MKGFQQKIMATDFGKLLKRLIIIALVVVVVGGGLSAWMMRTQIAELSALDRAEEQSVQAIENIPQNSVREDAYGDGEHDREHDHGDREIDPFDAGLVTRPTTPAIAAFIGWLALCGLCALAYWLLVAAWLYKAAVQAGMNRALWPILGLAGNLLAVAAFLIVRGRLSCCAKCGAWQKLSVYCRSCGSLMERKCPKCGAACGTNDAYCPKCGTVLDVPDETAEK
jgi:hypothetical protein